MKTSISSEALTQFGAEKIAFRPKPDGRTDLRTDISNYRVDSLLKTYFKVFYKLCLLENCLILKY